MSDASLERVTGPAVANEAAAGRIAPVLQLNGIVRRFGGLTAVAGLSMSLGPHERLAVIGPNGAGKTTLFRLIAGELHATQGRIELFGRDVTGLPAHRRARMGLSRTFQVSNLFANLSVSENLRLAAQAGDRQRWRFWAPIRRTDPLEAQIDQLLHRVGIESRREDRVSELSHGEQRQLEIAMALATRPRILLLDEPAAGLSAGERSILRDLLQSLPRTLPYILIEHDMSLAMGLADRVLCMHNGAQIAMGSPAEVRADPQVRTAYLGRLANAS